MFVWGALRCAGGIDIENLIKSPMIHTVSYFDLGGLVVCLGVLSPPKPPVATGLMVLSRFSGTTKSNKNLK